MSTDIRLRGRPRGDKREALKTWMAERPRFTMGELARSMGWPISAANKTLQRAKDSGEVRINGTVACAGVKRPVAVFEPVGARGCGDLHQVMSIWQTRHTG